MKTIYLHTIASELMCLGYREEMVLKMVLPSNRLSHQKKCCNNINSCPPNPPGSSVRMRQSMPSEWQSKHIPARVFFLQRCFRIIMNNAMYTKMCEMIKIPLHNTWTSQESHCHLLCGSCRDCSICAGRGKLSLLLPSKSSLILGFFFSLFTKGT